MSRGMGRDLGMLLLGVYLVLVGVTGLVSFGLPPIVMTFLALSAGVLIIAGR